MQNLVLISSQNKQRKILQFSSSSSATEANIYILSATEMRTCNALLLLNFCFNWQNQQTSKCLILRKPATLKVENNNLKSINYIHNEILPKAIKLQI